MLRSMDCAVSGSVTIATNRNLPPQAHASTSSRYTLLSKVAQSMRHGAVNLAPMESLCGALHSDASFVGGARTAVTAGIVEPFRIPLTTAWP
jgi:hypothetical protein